MSFKKYAKMQFHMMALLDVLGKIAVKNFYPYVKSQISLSGVHHRSCTLQSVDCYAVWMLRFCEFGSLSFSSCRRCHVSLRVFAVLFNQSPGWTIHDYFSLQFLLSCRY